MGRPRKVNEEVRDFKEMQQEITDAPEETMGNQVVEPPTYTGTLLGILSDERGSFVVEVQANLKGDVSPLKIVRGPEGKDIMRESFRIEAATKIL